MRTEAFLSTDRKYRYWLIRVWDDLLPIVAVIGVNPSTADETVDDPTIRKDMGFARRLGFGGILKLNVGAYRSTDPKAWRKALDPFGSENSAWHLAMYARQFGATKTIAAWGRNGSYAPGRCQAIVKEFGSNLWCFGKNPDGTPRHTLMLPYSTELVSYRGGEVSDEQ